MEIIAQNDLLSNTTNWLSTWGTFKAKDWKELNCERLDSLCRSGWNINETDNHGWSVLHRLASWANPQLLQKAVDLGAEINKQTDKKETPLMIALKIKNMQNLSTLYDCGADITLADAEGAPPLFYSLHDPKNIFLPFLLERGASVKQTDAQGQTILHQMIDRSPKQFQRMKDERLITLINSGFDVNAQNNAGNTILHMLFTNRSTEPTLNQLFILLHAGANPFIPNNGNQTPYQLCTQFKSRMVIDDFLAGKQELSLSLSPEKQQELRLIAHQIRPVNLRGEKIPLHT